MNANHHIKWIGTLAFAGLLSKACQDRSGAAGGREKKSQLQKPAPRTTAKTSAALKIFQTVRSDPSAVVTGSAPETRAAGQA